MRTPSRILVTGGAGFVGSAFIRYLFTVQDFTGKVINYDLLTYAANVENVAGIATSRRYSFLQGDILDRRLLEESILREEIDTIVHFAAESHVDRSIRDPLAFIETNIKGTFVLLELVRKFPHIHFHHISTDEVYGSLGDGGFFNERSSLRPNSPYAASKAASDHLVRSYIHTYGISATVSHCSNNYGPCQHSEKLIPLTILNAAARKPIPLYGTGVNVRQWLYVEDHASAVWEILCKGKNHETYDIGGNDEVKNREIVETLVRIVGEETGKEGLEDLIRLVPDRPGHDFRYAIDDKKIRNELGWQPRVSLQEGLRKTVRWYLKRVSTLSSGR